MIIYKLYPNKDDVHMYERVEHKVINKFNGPAWRMSWSLTGNMIAISAAT